MQAKLHRAFLPGLLLPLALCLPAIANAQSAYDIVEAGYGGYSRARGLNNLGQVVGDFTDPNTQNDHAYLYSNGQSQEIYPTPFFRSGSGAAGINDNGQVATGYQSHAYIYDTRTNTRLGLGPNDQASTASAINQNGVMVGDVDFGTGPTAYLFDPRVGSAQILPTFAGEYGKPGATALNNLGDVVGVSGFITGPTTNINVVYLYHNGLAQNLGTLPGGFYADASGINDSGDIVGYSDGTGISEGHAFLYHNGKMQDLGTLYPTDPNSAATAINNVGDVVGVSGNFPFLYHNGQMQNLFSLIGPSSGWSDGYASAINDQGQIAGWGFHNGIETGFLMTPRAAATPAPGSLLTFGAGIGAMLLAARRRKRRVPA